MKPGEALSLELTLNNDGPDPARGKRQRETSDKRARRPLRPPVGELMRVAQHRAELPGDRPQGDVLHRRCRELSADPDKAAELLEVVAWVSMTTRAERDPRGYPVAATSADVG